jgi:hypothetical protein
MCGACDAKGLGKVEGEVSVEVKPQKISFTSIGGALRWYVYGRQVGTSEERPLSGLQLLALARGGSASYCQMMLA